MDVTLKDSSNNFLRTTTTGDDPNTPGIEAGYYQFTGLCGNTYHVEIENESSQLPGYVRTQSGAGTLATDSNPNPSTVVLASNTAFDQTIDFGYTCPIVTLSPPMLPSGTVGQPYGQQIITASGGNGSYDFTVTQGSLPPGLMLSSGGLLSGHTDGIGQLLHLRSPPRTSSAAPEIKITWWRWIALWR